ncbi:hypothetical protein J6590_048028 [Homalodisca vitripennis]|nr:hypothetical protein J6590_048028 [Homalodisca vitripennis]
MVGITFLQSRCPPEEVTSQRQSNHILMLQAVLESSKPKLAPSINSVEATINPNLSGIENIPQRRLGSCLVLPPKFASQ